MTSAFVTFEGLDGCGKSTQLRMLARELYSRGFEVVTTREPGGTPLGEKLREVLLDAGADVDPLAELLLFAADRANHVRTIIEPALKTGHIVLSDRYADATIAYQGAGRRVPADIVRQIVSLATGGLTPDLTLIFDVPVDESHARTLNRLGGDHLGGDKSSNDRYDTEDIEFRIRVRKAYLGVAESEPDRVVIINANGSIEEIHALVVETVFDRLKLHLDV
ncbi:MAG: dTMP kinase [Pyrinomonadaceae bacterium]